MPIRANTAKECFDTFSRHIRWLISKTVTEQPPVIPLPTGSQRIQLSFRENQPVAAPIAARYGRLYFYLAQLLEAVHEEDGQHRLRTLQYWYRLQTEVSPQTQATIRWEYVRAAPRNGYERHHVQVPATVPLSSEHSLDLNKIHMPTGWVTIESIIRFLIVDLGFNPPCGDEWPNILEKSEQYFYEHFTGKRYASREP